MIIPAVLALVGITILVWICLRASNTSPDADLHLVRRRLDISLTRGEIKRDAMRLRRELDNELKELP